MNQMVCVSSFAPFFSLSPSPSKSPFASRQSLCLVSYVFPQSKSQPDRITTCTNFLSNNNFDYYYGKIGRPRQPHWKEIRGCGKVDAISGQEGKAGEGCVPNVICYSTLINSLCKKGEIEKAIDILHDMISKECEPIFPNVVFSYAIIIDGLCKKGEIDKAIDILHDMISKECEPHIVTYNTLLGGLFKKGEIKKVVDVLDVMISKGREPDVVTYNILIDGVFQKDEIKKALASCPDLISEGHDLDSIHREMEDCHPLATIVRDLRERGYGKEL